MSVFRIINTVDELIMATHDRTARYLILRHDLTDVPSLRLMPFQSIGGEFDGKKIVFKAEEDGFCLSKGNELKNLIIETDPDKRAIYQDQEIESLNTHRLTRLSIKGQISIILTDKVKKGRIDASFIHIQEASTMHLTERPKRFGVEVIQGAFTIWNRSEENTEIELDITHFSCGTQTKPIQGSGLLLFGTEERMGSLKAVVVSCGHIYTDGSIGQGIADVVSAGINIGYQTLVRNLNVYGRITCYGGNEMGIYNWGLIERASITDRIETHGPNGCGIINAGNMGVLTMTHEIETFGTGARGFYMFDGAVKDLHFDRIVTHGDASTAIQFNRYIDRISISRGIEVFGNALDVLFADSIIKAAADGISIKPGGTVRMLKISGDVVTHGDGVHSIYDEASIERMMVSGKVIATGEDSLALEIKDGYLGAEHVTFISDKWAAIWIENAKINNSQDLVAKGKDFDLLIDIMSSVNKKIITKEFLEGIFQPDVRIEYIDNVKLLKQEAAETKIQDGSSKETHDQDDSSDNAEKEESQASSNQDEQAPKDQAD